ncbi:MAG: Na(+)/H(+) antiporter subunit C [Micrococcaceae bacterium]
MTLTAVLIVAMGVLFTGAIYLILERTLTRVLLGLVLFTNGANLLIVLMAGDAGLAPLVRNGVAPEEYFDPLPQALTLTSIVISFATTAFLLAMIYRSWKLARRDEVQADTEDLKVAEQPSFDAEEDAELHEEDSEFITDAEDPNAHYEYATESSPRAPSRAQGADRVPGTRPRPTDRPTGSTQGDDV